MKLAWTALFLLAQASPQEEYKTKLAAISKSSATKHYSIGDYLTTSQMHLWAREQFNRTIEFDPDHEAARKKLGYRKAEAGWENDASIKQEFANKKKGEEADRIKKQYGDRLEAAGRDLSRQWTDLGNWCKRAPLEAEAADAFRKAMEYDPANATARKELGFEKEPKGGWISKAERELRKEMKEGVGKAPQGAASTAETDVEQKLGLRNSKRESGNFLLESPHLKDAELGGLVQHAEHAYAIYHKIFAAESLFGGRKMTHLILKDKTQHERYVDAFHAGSPAQKDLARKSMGTGGFPRAEQAQDTRPIANVEDTVVHGTAEALSRMFVGGDHHWLHEGVAYYFTRLIKGTAGTYCVDLVGTGPKSDGKSYQDAANWPIVCKVWVREGKDPNVDEVLKCTNLAEFSGAETVKAWSLVEFLIAEHREKFIGLCKALAGGADIESGLKAVWGWTPGELDLRWKQYVRMTY